MHRTGNMILVAVVAVAAVATVAGLVGTRSSRGATDETTPAWLQTEATKAVARYSVDQVESATWSLTTVGTYHEVVPDQGEANAEYADNPLYVIVVNGRFSETSLHRGQEEEIAGTQMLLVYDGRTHEQSMFGLLNTPVDASRLGVAKPIGLDSLRTQ